MPEQDRFVPIPDTERGPSKGTSMYQTGKSPVQKPVDITAMDADEVPMPLGKNKGKSMSSAAKNDVREFVKIFNNLNKIAAMEKPPPNYDETMQVAHQKMGEYIKTNNLEKKAQDLDDRIKKHLQPKEEPEEQVTDVNTVPDKKVFMGEFAKFPKKYAGMPISEIDDYGLSRIHMYFNYGLVDDNRDLFHKHKDFYDNLTKILLEKNVIQMLDGEVLYPKDIEFYNQYKGSQPVGSVGENNRPLDVEIVSKPHSRDLKKDGGGKYYYMWILKEIDTSNIIQFRDYLVGSQKDKNHNAQSFEYEMMKLRRKNGASIEADISSQGVYKGVMRTNIYNPTWVQKIDNIHGEIDKIIPDEMVNTPQRQEKLKDLVSKYTKQESVIKTKPSLNEHVEKLMKIINYKRVIK